MSNQHLSKGRHKREIDRHQPPIEIRGFAYKELTGNGGRIYIITMPLLNIRGYRYITETMRLVL
jgi:hypothetical protein